MLTLKSAVIGLVVNSIKLHFLTLTESLLSLNQLFISESTLFALYLFANKSALCSSNNVLSRLANLRVRYSDFGHQLALMNVQMDVPIYIISQSVH